MVLIITTLILLLFVTLLYRHKRCQRYRLPTGPRGLPFIGNAHQFVKNPHLKLSTWAKKFGGMYTIYLGPSPCLVVTDAKLQRELFSMPAATTRFKNDSLNLISGGNYGVVNSEGKVWLEQRQFLIKNLKQFGFGHTNVLEAKILEEVSQLCEWIDEEMTREGTVTLFQTLTKISNNVIWIMVTGEKSRLTNNSKISSLLQEFIMSLQYTVKTGLAFIPWLKYIAPGLSGYTQHARVCGEIHDHIRDTMNTIRKSWVPGAPPRHVMDAYLQQLEDCKDLPDSSFCGERGLMNTVAVMVELFVAGSDPVSGVLNWLIFYLIQNEHVQRKVQQEIDNVYGPNGEPSLIDKQRMPYTCAVIMESLRHSSIVPQGVLHQLNEDVNFHDYYLPNGLLLMINQYGINHDPNVWGDPENFRPERFLTADESSFSADTKLKDNIATFQPGRRVCIGEQLTLSILFLSVTKLFQKYNVSRHPLVSSDNFLEADVGLIMMPKKVGVVMKNRQL